MQLKYVKSLSISRFTPELSVQHHPNQRSPATTASGRAPVAAPEAGIARESGAAADRRVSPPHGSENHGTFMGLSGA